MVMNRVDDVGIGLLVEILRVRSVALYTTKEDEVMAMSEIESCLASTEKVI